MKKSLLPNILNPHPIKGSVFPFQWRSILFHWTKITLFQVVTTAAYMCETGLHEIHDGIGVMVTEVLKLAK